MIVAMSWKMVMNAPNCTGGNTAGAGLDGLSKPVGVRRCMCAMSWRCRIPVCYFFRYGHGGAARFQGCIWNTAQTTALRASASCVDLRTWYKYEEGELKFQIVINSREKLPNPATLCCVLRHVSVLWKPIRAPLIGIRLIL